ncbi:hypothetical protein HKW98_15030 [Stutzerimonas urumqiensis]|uniref:hypothetical protein n=1 Tax=Stutzerimonas urumqiensis TaxID=638269 RepID=UPI003BADB056
MKTLIASLILASTATTALATAQDATVPSRSERSALTLDLHVDGLRLAEDGFDRTPQGNFLNDSFGRDQDDGLVDETAPKADGVRMAEDGSERTQRRRVAEDGFDRTPAGQMFAEGGSDRLGRA